MKILLLAILLTGCVTFPRHYIRYECSPAAFKELAKYTDTCIQSTARTTDKRADMSRYITQCRENAMAILCERKSYFKVHSIPFGPSKELPCTKASTAAEHFVCQTGQ